MSTHVLFVPHVSHFRSDYEPFYAVLLNLYLKKFKLENTFFYHTTQKIEAVSFFSFCRTYTLIDKVISQFGEEIQKVKDRSKRKETP